MSYCTRADIENAFGRDNVAEWADLNNDGDPDTVETRIDWAIARAGTRIDLVLGKLYATPLSGPPQTLIDACAALAGCLLYDSRGIIDRDADGEITHSLSWHRNDAFRVLRAIAGGAYDIGLEPLVNTAPIAIVDDKTIARRGYEQATAWSSSWPSDSWEDQWWAMHWGRY